PPPRAKETASIQPRRSLRRGLAALAGGLPGAASFVRAAEPLGDAAVFRACAGVVLRVAERAVLAPRRRRTLLTGRGRSLGPATPRVQDRLPLVSLDIRSASAPAPMAFTSCGFFA